MTEEPPPISDADKGEKRGKKKKKRLSTSPKNPDLGKSEPSQEGKKEISPPAPAIDPEIAAMMNKIRNMDHDLVQKMEKIFELCGMTKKEVEGFIANPGNFSDIQWMKAQEEAQSLEEKIHVAMGSESKKTLLKKKSVKMSKERKGKTLGGRKGWIQM